MPGREERHERPEIIAKRDPEIGDRSCLNRQSEVHPKRKPQSGPKASGHPGGPGAYLGVAFGDYLGAFAPFFSSRHVIASIPLRVRTWQPKTVSSPGFPLSRCCRP